MQKWINGRAGWATVSYLSSVIRIRVIKRFVQRRLQILDGVNRIAVDHFAETQLANQATTSPQQLFVGQAYELINGQTMRVTNSGRCARDYATLTSNDQKSSSRSLFMAPFLFGPGLPPNR